MSKFKIRKIIWAVDVFTDLESCEWVAGQAIDQLLTAIEQEEGEVEILPVCVAVALIGEEDFPFIEHEINERLTRLRLPNRPFKPVVVIAEHDAYPPTVSDRVLTLIDFATKNNFDLIMATTHSNKGFGENLLGSFTEILFQLSPISLFLVSPETPAGRDLKNVLWPIDLTQNNFLAADNVADLVTLLSTRLYVYHHIFDYATKYFAHIDRMKALLNRKQEELFIRARRAEMNLRDIWKDYLGTIEFETEADTRSASQAIIDRLTRLDGGILLLTGPATGRFYGLLDNTQRFLMRHVKAPTFILRSI